MPSSSSLRIACVLLLVVAGCTSIAGLDDLHLASPAPAVGATEPPPDGASEPSNGHVPDGPAHDVDGSPGTTPPDAGPDVERDLSCLFDGTCPCDTPADCPSNSFSCCNHVCVDTTSDSAHCGGCGNPCSPTFVCQGGTCGCGGLEADQVCVPGVCIDFVTDPNHCGACNHSCQGGACLGQACQAFPLATKLDEPMGLAVDAEHVYFTTRGNKGLGRVSKNAVGACTGVSCTKFTSETFDDPVDVATAAGDPYVYVVNSASGRGSVVRVSKTLTDATPIVTSPTGIADVAVHDGHVFWTTSDPTSVIGRLEDRTAEPYVRVPSAPVQVGGMAFDEQNVFFTVEDASDDGLKPGIYKTSVAGTGCRGNGCTTVFSAPGVRPKRIFASDRYLFWSSDDGKIRRMNKSCAGSLTCVASVLAEGQNTPTALVADSGDKGYVYWANTADEDGTIRRTSVVRSCKGVGCQAVTKRIGQIHALAQDDTALYITSRSNGGPKSGVLWKLAK